MLENEIKFKKILWKSCVVAPEDASRPNCNVKYSYDGVASEKIINEKTDFVDWLLVIEYQANEK
jgi:hypothetical protein